MKKLDDIPGKQPFEVPDGYFEQLPGRIQARIQGAPSARAMAFGYSLRYAAAVVVLGIVAAVWLWRPSTGDSQSPEAILASVGTSDLVAYLNEGDITTDELLDGLQLDNEDATAIAGAVFDLDLGDANIGDSSMNLIDTAR